MGNSVVVVLVDLLLLDFNILLAGVGKKGTGSGLLFLLTTEMVVCIRYEDRLDGMSNYL